MSVADQISTHLPYLRRYGRALTGSQASGDAYVRATLEAALADEELRKTIGRSRADLYKAFNMIWLSSQAELEDEPETELEAGASPEVVAHRRLAQVTPLHRQALLLTTIEDFSSEEAGRVLDLEPGEVDTLVSQAFAEIEGESATDVLIIEDEPLISMQLEGLVTSLGHRVAGTAATRTQARQVFEERKVGLVLADIQLADGSSGIDAVDDILQSEELPVIFITAYPERLLTGERPEPTYLVTKPFQEATVRAAISQALFFGGGKAVN